LGTDVGMLFLEARELRPPMRVHCVKRKRASFLQQRGNFRTIKEVGKKGKGTCRENSARKGQCRHKGSREKKPGRNSIVRRKQKDKDQKGLETKSFFGRYVRNQVLGHLDDI